MIMPVPSSSLVVLGREHTFPLGSSHDPADILHPSAVRIELGRTLLGDGQAKFGLDPFPTPPRVPDSGSSARMSDMQRREGVTHGVAVGAAVPQLAQQGLESPVILQDQLDDVTGDRSAEIDWGRCHGATLTPRPPMGERIHKSVLLPTGT
jgi:hypothetical protein